MKKLLTLLLVLILGVPAYAADADTTTLTEIRTQVKEILGIGGSSSFGGWTNTVINSMINLNCREYATLIGIPKEDTIITAYQQTDYILGKAGADSTYSSASASDFWTVRGVVRISNGRKMTLRQKGINETSPGLQGIGESSVDTWPLYYVIKNQTITFDPVVTGKDTIIVTYNAYATNLTADATATNIRYGGIPVVIWGTVLNCMIINREDNFVAAMIPLVEKKYQAVFSTIKAQEQSSRDYDPSFKAQ